LVVHFVGSDSSLWVSGLTPSFRAVDLKQLFGKFGKVGYDDWHCSTHSHNCFWQLVAYICLCVCDNACIMSTS